MTPLYRRSESALFSNVGDDIVALHVENGRCYGMEKATAAIWDLLAEPIAIDQLVERLTTTYDVEPTECRTDLERIIGQLEQEGLVTVVQ
ncbi:MAG TPA: PqqD family peptide modification chaperone [Sphingomicrobium sp.]|nr:PqqD family peptide modification chaperone [Sphingomicrobium sp.]